MLYDVRRPVRGVLMTGSRGPSTITARAFEARLAELTAEPRRDRRTAQPGAAPNPHPAAARRAGRLLRRADRRRARVPGLPAAQHHRADQRGHRAAPGTPRRGHRHGRPGRRAHRRADARAAHRRARHTADRRVPGGQGAGPAGRATHVGPPAAKAHASYWRSASPIPARRSNCSTRAGEALRAAPHPAGHRGHARRHCTVSAPPGIARFGLAEPTIREPDSPPSDDQTRKATADAASTSFRAVEAPAGGPRRSLLLRPGGVLVPRRTIAAARQQRHRQVEGARPDAAVPARWRPLGAPHRA